MEATRRKETITGLVLILILASFASFAQIATSINQTTTYPSISWTPPQRLSINESEWHSPLSWSNPAIAIDSGGNLHIVFSEQQILYHEYDGFDADYIWDLYYCTNNSGSWTLANVVREYREYASQFCPVIAIDSNDMIHVVWSGETSKSYDIFYVNNSGGSWTSPYNLTGTPDQNEYDCSITIDTSDTLHVAVLDYTDRMLRYVNKSSAGIWSASENVTMPPSFPFADSNWASGLSIDTDSSGHAYIVFAEHYLLQGDAYAYICNNSAGTWNTPHNLSVGHSPKAAADSADNIHIAWFFRNSTSVGIKYATHNEGGWSEPLLIETSNESLAGLSLAVDLNNKIHIAFPQRVLHQGFLASSWSNDILYSNNIEGSFSKPVGVVDTPSVSEAYPHLLIDREGVVHIVYNGYSVSSDKAAVYYVRSWNDARGGMILGLALAVGLGLVASGILIFFAKRKR